MGDFFKIAGGLLGGPLGLQQGSKLDAEREQKKAAERQQKQAETFDIGNSLAGNTAVKQAEEAKQYAASSPQEASSQSAEAMISIPKTTFEALLTAATQNQRLDYSA